MKPPKLKHVGQRFGVGRRGQYVFFHDKSAEKGVQVAMGNTTRARKVLQAFVETARDPGIHNARLSDKTYLSELVERALRTLDV